MRAYTFTNYAGRFLYVEAHNKANTTTGGPALALSYAGPDGVYRPLVNIGRTVTPDGGDAAIGGNKFSTRGAYMYHRGWSRCAAPTRTCRQRGHGPRRGRTGATDTSDATEWTGKALPPRIAGVPEGLHHEVHGPDRDLQPDGPAHRAYPEIMEAITCRTRRRATSVRRWR